MGGHPGAWVVLALLPGMVPPAAPGLQETVAALAAAASGRVGAAALLVETGAGVAVNGNEPFPMQSVFKLPLALHVLHLVDQGRLRLDAQVPVAPADMRRGHSPIRDRWPGGVTLTLEELLRYAVAESDNTAADVLLARSGGPAAVSERLAALDVVGMRVDRGEAELAADLLDGGRPALDRYLADPRDTATPNGAVELLAHVARGGGLRPATRARLLRWLTETPTGPRRIKGRLPRGVAVAHKTGTGPTVDGINACTNDIGLITLPDGRHAAVAVFVKGSPAGEAEREEVIARIARAVYDSWSGPSRR
ncbi:MAG TPA: class A beta-lactamase [Vicinamibacteria bacterium]|nr:class A beta-lactamase [Vicinamibacteria bacterium]